MISIPLLAQDADYLAQAFILFLNILVRTRHQVIMLMLMNPLVEGRKPNTQI